MPTNDESLRLKDFTTLTIASGVVTATQQLHIIAAETGTADDLDTITVGFSDLIAAGNTYRPSIRIKADSGDTITVKDSTGNIALASGGDYTLTGEKLLELQWNGTSWNDVVSSTSGGISTPVSIANGGTGQITAQAAFDALSPTTTQGDIIYDNGANDARLAIGTAGQLLRVNSGATAPEYASVAPAIAGSMPAAEYTLNEVADYTTTSTSFVDVDATNLSLTITTNGGDVMIGGTFYVESLSGGRTQLDVYESVGAARLAGDDGMLVAQPSVGEVVTLSWIVSGLSAASHTFKLQWKNTTGNNSTLFAGAGTSNKDIHSQFWVRELP
jgi:hypothetical protein